MLCSLLSLIATARPRALPRPLQHSRSCSLCYLRNRLYASPRWAADRETDRRADMLGAVIKRLSLGSLARPHQRGQVPSLSKGHRFLSGGPDRSCGSVRGRGGCRAPRSVFATAPVPAVSWTCKIRNAGSEFVGVSASFPHKSKGDSRAARSGASLPGAVPAPRSRPPAPTGPAHPQGLLGPPRQQLHAAHVETDPGRRLRDAGEDIQGGVPVPAVGRQHALMPAPHQLPVRHGPQLPGLCRAPGGASPAGRAGAAPGRGSGRTRKPRGPPPPASPPFPRGCRAGRRPTGVRAPRKVGPARLGERGEVRGHPAEGMQ